jgi:excisionase family DNA binding protein
MQSTNQDARLGIDEHEAAKLLGLSVHTLRKDRTTHRRIPFYRIGKSIRYNAARLGEALAAMEVGGPMPAPRSARRT